MTPAAALATAILLGFALCLGAGATGAALALNERLRRHERYMAGAMSSQATSKGGSVGASSPEVEANKNNSANTFMKQEERLG